MQPTPQADSRNQRPESRPVPPEPADIERVDPEAPGPGSRCPACRRGILDYDGLLVLRCPLCDFAEGGCFT